MPAPSLPPVAIVGIGQRRPTGIAGPDRDRTTTPTNGALSSTAPGGEDRRLDAPIISGRSGAAPPVGGRSGTAPTIDERSDARSAGGGRSGTAPADGRRSGTVPAHGRQSDAPSGKSGSSSSGPNEHDRSGFDGFDSCWFGMTDQEAAELDSWQRVGLEVAVEALDDAGVGYSARGSNAAVVFGACGCGGVMPCRYGSCGDDAARNVSARMAGDGARRAAVNVAHRLSRVLELRGPSLVLDSGGSSSVVAVDMAVRLLADGTVPFVLAGGVDLALRPGLSDNQRGLVAAGAEPGTCTVVVLRRTTDARLAGSRIYAEIAGTTGFHSAGTHIPLREDRTAALNDQVARLDRGDEPPVLIPIGGRDVREVHDTAMRWAASIGTCRSLREFAAAAGRLLPSDTRAAILARDRDDAAVQLRELARRVAATNQPVSAAERRSGANDTAVPGRAVTADVFGPTGGAPAAERGAESLPGSGGLLFLFSGASEPYPGMARSLAARYPVFARGLMDATDAIVAADGPRVWTPRFGFGSGGAGGHGRAGGNGGAGGEYGDRGEFAQAATFAYQVAMAGLLRWWGVRPDAVAGYGSGEVAAAAVSGALSVTDAARVVVARSRILSRLGDMDVSAVLEATAVEAMRLVEPMRAAVAVAAIDSPRSVTISGEPRYIDALVRRAHRRTIFAQRTLTNGSWHPAMPGPRARDLAPELVARLREITPNHPGATIYSTTRNGAAIRGAEMDAEYWGENIAGPVNLAAALDQAATHGVSSILELAPQSSLHTVVREHLAFRDSTYTVATRSDEAPALMRALAHLHLEGRAIDWIALGPFTASPPKRSWRREAATAPMRQHEQEKPSGPAGPSTNDGQTLRNSPQTVAALDEQSASEAPPIPVRELFPVMDIVPERTYVVTGGLGAAGVAAVCWLLEAGAYDVVLLTPAPRALPPALHGMEDRIVLVRCDIADREDLAQVLHDLRECGPPICGVVHAESAADGVIDRYGIPAVELAANVLELTAADATDFTVLVATDSRDATALDKLAGAHGYRQVVRVDWDDGTHRRR
ncbi:acyltransferase domain-containing protein [Nocardia uniformis]|nr:acyltransferase domain-containing protein [Nocardia uniformis]